MNPSLELFLRERQLNLDLVVELEVEDEVVVPRLALLDGRVDVDDEVHLALVLVRQHEEPHDVGQRDLVVERLAVEVEERGEHLDVVAAPGREAVDLAEDGDGVARGRHHGGLLHDLLLEHLDGVVGASELALRDVEAHLAQHHGGVVVVVELEGDLVLAGQALEAIV